MSYQYKIVYEPGRHSREHGYDWAERTLAGMDAQGWEFVTATHSAILGDTLYFRRPTPPPAPPAPPAEQWQAERWTPTPSGQDLATGTVPAPRWFVTKGQRRLECSNEEDARWLCQTLREQDARTR